MGVEKSLDKNLMMCTPQTNIKVNSSSWTRWVGQEKRTGTGRRTILKCTLQK